MSSAVREPFQREIPMVPIALGAEAMVGTAWSVVSAETVPGAVACVLGRGH
jgi:hypothetical protein